MYVCICAAVTEKDIRDLMAQGGCTAVDVMTRTGAGSGCGTCRSAVVAMVEGSSGSSGEPPREEAAEEPACGVRRLRVIRAASSAA